MRRAAVVGASGYTGAELLRLVAGHPDLELTVATADTRAGTPLADVHPALAAAHPDVTLEPLDAERLGALDLDVAFLALPHAASLDLVPQLVGRVGCLVDLSAAFRLTDPALYPTWYGFEHTSTELLAAAVYGLPELHRAELPGASLVATPGCYVTAATLALAPLVRAGAVEADRVIVDAASGVTGAGAAPSATTHFASVDENLSAYGLEGHRHTCEMEQEIGARVLFVPHLAPMNRGILATCYATPAVGTTPSTEALLGVLAEAYRDEPFVVVAERSPSTKATLGSNAVHVTARYDERTGQVVVISALDNLTKGASGGAVQAANVAIGLDEMTGLTTVGLSP